MLVPQWRLRYIQAMESRWKIQAKRVVPDRLHPLAKRVRAMISGSRSRVPRDPIVQQPLEPPGGSPPPTQVDDFGSLARRYVNGLITEIEENSDQATLAELQDLGPIYADILPVDKAIQDLRVHGSRYVAMSEIFGEFDLARKSRVMEVGCNTGFLSFILKRRHPELEVLAVDKSTKQIRMNELVKKLLGTDVRFITAAGDLTSYASEGSVDTVFVCELLEHFEYWSETQLAILQDSVAVCSSKGRLVITVPYEDRIPAPGHLTEFTRPMLERLIGGHCSDLEWLEPARHAYGLQKHFILVARP